MSGLTAKQEQAIAALLTEPSVAAAAAKVRSSERTLHRWLDDPAFETAYRLARRKAVQQAIGRLQQVSSAAVAVLMRLMADASTPAGTRLQAAKTLLEMAIRAVELEDLEARIKRLEEVTHARS